MIMVMLILMLVMMSDKDDDDYGDGGPVGHLPALPPASAMATFVGALTRTHHGGLSASGFPLGSKRAPNALASHLPGSRNKHNKAS